MRGRAGGREAAMQFAEPVSITTSDDFPPVEWTVASPGLSLIYTNCIYVPSLPFVLALSHPSSLRSLRLSFFFSFCFTL